MNNNNKLIAIIINTVKIWEGGVHEVLLTGIGMLFCILFSCPQKFGFCEANTKIYKGFGICGTQTFHSNQAGNRYLLDSHTEMY